ncbi:hypothetical protein ACOSQ3_031503 [Xanthoceras sorbifolium]
MDSPRMLVAADMWGGPGYIFLSPDELGLLSISNFNSGKYRSGSCCGLVSSLSVIVSSSRCRYFGKRPRMACIPHSRNALRLIVKESSDCVLHHPLLYACQGVRYRRLEVILTTKIDKLGSAGETVKVAPGYFRNHLMPKLLAVPNIEKYAHLIREQRKIYQPVEEKEVKVVKKTADGEKREYEKAARCLENARLVLKRLPDIAKLRSRESKDDPIHLRSPVTKEELVAEVARQLLINIEPENLHFPTSMSTFGEYEVPLRLPRSIPLPEGKVQWTLNVKVRGK